MKTPLFSRVFLAFIFLIVISQSVTQGQVKTGAQKCGYPIISEVNNQLAFIDDTGRVIIAAGTTDDSLQSVEDLEPSEYFSEGLVTFEVEGKWGFMDCTARVVIAPSYSAVLPFSEGLAAVQATTDGGQLKWGFINRRGQFAIAPNYEKVFSFSGGRAAVQVEDSNGAKWGFIDKNGGVVIKPLYLQVQKFSDGLAAVRQTSDTKSSEKKWGFIDSDGKMIISPKYAGPPLFSEGRAALRLPGNQLGFIDKLGNVITTSFQFSHFTASFLDAHYRGYDPDLDELYDQEVGERPIFSDGLYPVQIGKKWGYVDESGKLKIAPRFRIAGNFHEGKARVAIGKAVGFIDSDGKYTIQPRFVYASDFYNGLALVFFKKSFRTLPTQAEEKRKYTVIYGYLDASGQTIFKGKNTFLSELQGGELQEVTDFPPQVPVLINSTPEEANIYLVPLADLVLDANITRDDAKLSKYLLSRQTNYQGDVNQQVYMVILERHGKRLEPRKLDAHEKTINKVDVAFDQPRDDPAAPPATGQKSGKTRQRPRRNLQKRRRGK